MNKSKIFIIILTVIFAILIAAGVIIAVVMLGGDGIGSDEDTTIAEENISDAELFYDDIDVKSVKIRNTDGLYYVDAEVKIINYIPYMEECFEEAEESSDGDADFQGIFYKAVSEASEDAKKEKQEITFCLYSVDPERTDWDEDELEDLVKQKAFDKQVSEFAMNKLYELMPEISESDGEVAE